MQNKHLKARKYIVIGGAAILFAITALSCVSSFLIYRDGFADMPYIFQQVLSLFAVLVVEGCFVWLVFGFTRAFSSAMERLICIIGLAFIVGVMLVNLTTHFMQAKGVPLHRYQQEWIEWGAVTVFIGVLLIVLFITLADPIARLLRLELRYSGKQQETIIEAKSEALESDRIRTAMTNRANSEAEQLAQQIEGETVFPAELDTRSNYRSGHRERLEFPAQKLDPEREISRPMGLQPRAAADGLAALLDQLKTISFRMKGYSFKAALKPERNPDHVYIRMVRFNGATQETVSSMKAKPTILTDVLTMPDTAFRARLEKMLRQNGFEI